MEFYRETRTGNNLYQELSFQDSDALGDIDEGADITGKFYIQIIFVIDQRKIKIFPSYLCLNFHSRCSGGWVHPGDFASAGWCFLIKLKFLALEFYFHFGFGSILPSFALFSMFLSFCSLDDEFEQFENNAFFDDDANYVEQLGTVPQIVEHHGVCLKVVLDCVP